MKEIMKLGLLLLLAYMLLMGVRSCVKWQSPPVVIEQTRPPVGGSSYSRPNYPIVIDQDAYHPEPYEKRWPIIAKVKERVKKILPKAKKPAKKRHVVQESKKAVKKASPPPPVVKTEPEPKKGFWRRQWARVPAVPKDDGRSYDKCHKNNFSRFCIKELK